MTTSNKITLGFSPCPNDTFIFDAIVNGKIDTEGLIFDFIIEDVEALNRKAFENILDVTKISFNAYTKLTKNYILLNSGAALGKNCGPLIIAKQNTDIEEFKNLPIAIPGENTTANLLMKIMFPEHKNKVEMLFSDIENAILTNKVSAGLIIHESRFTYQQKGLHKIIDLGEYWENKTKTPIPLGGIIAKRSLEKDVILKIDKIIKCSLEYAFQNPKSGLDFIKANSQDMSKEIIYKHINLYVNNYSLDLQQEGRKAVETLFAKAKEANIITEINENLFL